MFGFGKPQGVTGYSFGQKKRPWKQESEKICVSVKIRNTNFSCNQAGHGL